jgi:hypothetical protein
MSISCHILVEGNGTVIYASRNGVPNKILAILKPFLEKFWQERETSGEFAETPDCLAAQIIVRFGYEICEDDFSNLRVGLKYDPQVSYLYQVHPDRTVSVWTPTDAYRADPSLGLQGCVKA